MKKHAKADILDIRRQGEEGNPSVEAKIDNIPETSALIQPCQSDRRN